MAEKTNQETVPPPEAPISPYSTKTQDLMHELSQAESSTNLSAREVANLKERLADTLHVDGLIAESVRMLTESLDVYEGYKDKRAAARLCNKLGSTNFLMNNYGASIEYFSKQSEWGQQLRKFIIVATGLVNMGIVQLLTAQPDMAVESMDLAISALETCSGEEPSYLNLYCFVNHVKGTYYLANSEFEKARECHTRVFDRVQKQPPEEDPLNDVVFQSRTNLGICAIKEGSYKVAIGHFRACLELCENPFHKAKTLYHIAIANLNLESTDECDYNLEEAALICTKSVEKLAKEEKELEERLMKEHEEKMKLNDGQGNWIAGASVASKGELEKGSIDASLATAAGDDSLATVPTNLPVAFGTQEGAILHSQILNVMGLNQLYKKKGGCADPDIEKATDKVSAALNLSTRLYSPLAKAITLDAYGIIFAVEGDVEKCKKHHAQNLRVVEDSKSYKFLNTVSEGKPNLKPEVATILKYNSFSNSVVDKMALRMRAIHNQALSARSGVSMGLANESGTGSVSVTTMRQNMETHKKMYENCEKERDVRGSALAHGAIGSIITALGGRKADAFTHLDHQLNFSRSEGDKWLEASTLRTLGELQESSGDLKQAIKTLKRYEVLASEAGDPVLVADSVKRLIKAYSLIDQERKPLDIPMLPEEYDMLKNVDLDAREESDDQFLRANGANRAMRYIEKLKKSNHWSWESILLGTEDMLKQEDGHMAELKKKIEEELKNPGGGKGGGMLGGGGKKKKKKNGLLSMFG